jgi:hypothetical protein
MRILLALLFTLLPKATERPYQPQLDLEPMLHDGKALAKLVVMYELPTAGRGFRLFFVHGDGSLVLQMYPGRPMATTDIPTCTGQVTPKEIQDLIKAMMEKHFWSLPEKQYLLVNGEPPHEELGVHGIFVDNGSDKSARSFAVGTYLDKQESTPEDFAAIEQHLKKLADLTVLRPCHFAPALEF